MDGTAIAIAASNTSDVRQKRQHNHTQFFNNSSTDFTKDRKMAQLCDRGQIENIKEAVNSVHITRERNWSNYTVWHIN